MRQIEAYLNAKTAPARARLADTQHAFTMPNASKPIGELTESDKARFFAKINRDGPTMPHMETPCWLWTAFVDGLGYGRMLITKRSLMAHRIAFTIEVGQIPTGKIICHHCDNPTCVNTGHLFIGTDLDNCADKERKGRGNQPRGSKKNSERMARGEGIGVSKLTGSAVREMRKRHAAGETFAALGRAFQVTKVAARCAITRATWRHIF